MSRVEPTLENALSRDASLRERAVEAALGDWVHRPIRKNRAWARLLARAATGDSNLFVRNTAIEALAELGMAADRRFLTAALDDEWEVVRASAVSGLARVVGRRAERDILRATEDRSWLVRRYAWVALYDAMDAASEDRLCEAAKVEKDEEVSVGIWSSLLNLGHPEARALIETYAASENPRLNQVAKASLVELGRGPKRMSTGNRHSSRGCLKPSSAQADPRPLDFRNGDTASKRSREGGVIIPL